jgi:hypothetical protein
MGQPVLDAAYLETHWIFLENARYKLGLRGFSSLPCIEEEGGVIRLKPTTTRTKHTNHQPS